MIALVRLICLTLLAVVFASAELMAGTEARISEGKHNRTIDLRNYKRGLFFGSCGISTHSLQWEYTFHLNGDGPEFAAKNIVLQDGNLKEIPVRAGSIYVDSAKRTIDIDIRWQAAGDSESPFPHNGRYKFEKR